jgi:general stress protein 26
MTPANTTTADAATARTQLWTLIKDIRFAMFTTHHANGHLHSRPMTTQNTAMDEDNSLWFFMSRSGEPLADLLIDPIVNIVYADPSAASYVSISGNAALVEDPTRKQQLWSKGAAAWFPGGVADPDLALVRVSIVHADTWDNDAGTLVRLFHLAKAAVTGQPPAITGTHAEIRLG